MGNELTKVKLTMYMPFNKQTKNGNIFTEEAIKDAVYNLHKHLPIIYSDDGANGRVIGTTTGKSHIVTYDADNQSYKITVDGVLFNCNPIIRVNEYEDDKITDFRIASIGLTT